MVIGNHAMLVDLGFHRRLREKRATQRIGVRARICLSHSTFGVIHAYSRDISDSGMFVELIDKPHLPVGAHLKLQMLDSALPEIVFNMKVKRTDEEGVALSFVDYAYEGQRYAMVTLKNIWCKPTPQSP
jgi:hypothetical protein